MYICLDCYEIYNEDVLKEVWVNDSKFLCPKKNCLNPVVEIDEMIYPTVVELNKRGYVTEYCCSGHMYDDYLHAYIKFYDDCIEFIDENNLPEGFELTRSSLSINIYKKELTIQEKYEFIVETNKKLYEWALSLEPIEI